MRAHSCATYLVRENKKRNFPCQDWKGRWKGSCTDGLEDGLRPQGKKRPLNSNEGQYGSFPSLLYMRQLSSGTAEDLKIRKDSIET